MATASIRPLPELTEYRNAHRLTRAQLGADFGVSPVTVWRWEAGRRLPPRRHVRRLSEITGVPALEILGVAE